MVEQSFSGPKQEPDRDQQGNSCDPDEGGNGQEGHQGEPQAVHFPHDSSPVPAVNERAAYRGEQKPGQLARESHEGHEDRTTGEGRCKKRDRSLSKPVADRGDRRGDPKLREASPETSMTEHRASLAAAS